MNPNLGKPVSNVDGLAFAIALCLLLTDGGEGPRTCFASDAQPLSKLSQVYTLSQGQLARGLPFELRGTILCYDRGWNQLYLYTSGETCYFPPLGADVSLKPGDEVLLSGRTMAGRPDLPFTNVSVVVLGHAQLPAPKKIGMPQLASTTGAWVELEGQVRSADSSRERLGLLLRKRASSCLAYIMGGLPAKDCKAFIGARVRIHGINASRLVNGHIEESLIMVPSPAQVTVLDYPAAPITALPVVSIDSLLNRELGPWTNQPVHVNGVIVSAVKGSSLVVRDPTGLIRARVVQVTEANPGERVNLWGYLEASADQPFLADAYFEPLPSTAALVVMPKPSLPLTNAGVKTITHIAQLRRWPAAQLAEGFPVRLRGVVLYSDPDWGTAFVGDASAAIYAQLAQTNIVPGQVVEVTGRGALGAFGPAVFASRFEVLGTTNLPRPIPADLDDAADGNLDAQWVEMTGVVRKASAQWEHLNLTVSTHQGKFNVVVPSYNGTNIPARLLDSRVAVRGVCGSDVNARSQLSGVSLYAPNLACIKALEMAPADPFAMEQTPIAKVATFDSSRTAGRRVKIDGIVTLNLPGSGLFVEDSSGGIRVETPLGEYGDLRAGERVEVAGFPALGDFSPHLEEPIVRRLGSGSSPVPRKVTAEQVLLRGTDDSTLVCLEARLLQRIPRSAQPKLILQDGPIIFAAQLALGRFPQAVSEWHPGSLVRLTGLCAIQGAEDHTPQAFRVLLSSPDQLQLISSAPVWSLRELLVFAGGLGLFGLLAFSWITVLRRQVRLSTSELRASKAILQRQYENSRAFAELGRRLNEAANPKDAALIIADVADRLIGWDSCICDLYASETDLTTHVLNIDLVNGHRMEVLPQFTQVPLSSLARRVLQFGPQLILRTADELAQGPQLEGIPFGDTARRSASILYVPLGNGSNVVGLLSIQSYALDDYDQQDLETLLALAEHCSGALERILAHQQLIEVSRQVGMAEVATGVLHNVGNVLNSVNVSVSLLMDRTRDSHAARLGKISELFAAHAHDLPEFLTRDPKGQKVPAYLAQFATVVAGDENRVRSELEALAKNIEHIKEIVAMQQSYARLAGIAESVPAIELVEDALRLNAGTLARHQVEIRRNYPAHLPALTVDKHKVLQILINLIRNAKYACDESGREDKALTVSINNGGERVRISVADNGIGIPPENLTRIFTLGFSTRKTGHGFGLHSGALAAKELGGSLSVHSDGPGTGATFTLELPISAN